MKRVAFMVAPLVLAAALWMRSCSGPDVRVTGVRMRHDVALVTVRNTGGEGTVAVTVRAGKLVASQHAPLKAGEEAVVPVKVEGARGDEDVRAEVEYPPR